LKLELVNAQKWIICLVSILVTNWVLRNKFPPKFQIEERGKDKEIKREEDKRGE